MAIGQIKTSIVKVEDRHSSYSSLHVDDDADADVPYNVRIFASSTRHSRTYLSATPPVSTLIEQQLLNLSKLEAPTGCRVVAEIANHDAVMLPCRP